MGDVLREFNSYSCRIWATDKYNMKCYFTMHQLAYSFTREPAPIYTVGNKPKVLKRKNLMGSFVIKEMIEKPEGLFEIVIEAYNDEDKAAQMRIQNITSDFDNGSNVKFIADNITGWKFKE